eukprot:TRINITY_DN25920_c0_g1_i1.p1 TRINITY_DN25920_c0_g1~~TRINITY_DN25920_c0_g1_i1.p1  ORF type:complete len:214 (-),score=13.70 TRINITY_DN25920_c0_g1_i1:75-716(-)
MEANIDAVAYHPAAIIPTAPTTVLTHSPAPPLVVASTDIPAPKRSKNSCWAPGCSRKFATKEEMEAHLVHNEHFTCYRCQALFPNKEALDLHRFSVHPSDADMNTNVPSSVKTAKPRNMEGEDKDKICFACPRVFSSKKEIYEHYGDEPKHRNVVACLACGEVMKSKMLRIQHWTHPANRGHKEGHHIEFPTPIEIYPPSPSSPCSCSCNSFF